MGIIHNEPPPPQDSPPPKGWQKKNDPIACGPKCRRAVTESRPGMKLLAKSCCLSTPLQQLPSSSSSDVKTTVHEVFRRERVRVLYVSLLQHSS